MKRKPPNIRRFISIYFQNGQTDKRKKRDVTLAFSPDDCLYEKCKALGSSKIRRLIGINSYRDLVKKAQKNDRRLSNYIKYKLRKKLNLM